jgi:hypothetical protein
MAIHWDRRSYTEEEFIAAWNASSSIAECCRKLNVMLSGGAAKSFTRTARALGLSNSHMEKQYNATTGYRSSRNLEDILVEDSDYTNSSVLRRRLIREGVLKPICIGCNRDTWINFITGEEEPMNLTLDHINGINYDNRIENLRLLCPTCHSYTPTFCGKNKAIIKKCECGTRILSTSKRCNPCHNKTLSSKFENLTVEEVIQGVEEYGYSAYSKTISVSDNGVRVFLRKNDVNPLPKKKKK